MRFYCYELTPSPWLIRGRWGDPLPLPVRSQGGGNACNVSNGCINLEMGRGSTRGRFATFPPTMPNGAEPLRRANIKRGQTMSAYQVNQDTIDLIVSVLVSWNKRGGSPYVYTYGEPPTDPEVIAETEQHSTYAFTRADYTTADALGRELIDANVRSLATRYSDGVEMCHYYSESYTWKPILESSVSVARAMGAVGCYRYQACEFDGWRGSFAEGLANAAMDRLIGMIAQGWDYSRDENRNDSNVVSIFEMGGK